MSEVRDEIVSNYPRSIDPEIANSAALELWEYLGHVFFLCLTSWATWISMIGHKYWLVGGIGFAAFSSICLFFGPGRKHLVQYGQSVGWTRSQTRWAYGCLVGTVFSAGLLLIPLYRWMKRDGSVLKLDAFSLPGVRRRSAAEDET